MAEKERDSTMTSEDTGADILKYHDYVCEVSDFIIKRMQATPTNAMELNLKLRNMIIKLRTKLIQMRDQVTKRYKENEEKLKHFRKNVTNRRRDGKGVGYAIAGAPFFKDKQFFTAPSNSDYITRKTKLNEFFPIDLKLIQNGFWSVNDKILFIAGIREQIVSYLKINSSSGVSQRCETRNFSDLYSIVEKTQFKINWNNISIVSLKHRHTANECIGIWEEYFKPHLCRDPWTTEEDQQLIASAKRFRYQNWEAISNIFKNRSKLQCFLRYQCVLTETSGVKNTKWTIDEDKLLLEAIERYKIGNDIPWTKITELIPNRTKIQVYHRYIYSIKPTIKHGSFTKEEDCILMALVQEYGSNYSEIPPDILPGRTQLQIRHRINNVLKHSGKTNFWTVEDDKKLMELYKKHGSKYWSTIASELGNHTRLSCRTRYVTISKFLKKYPNRPLEQAPRKKKAMSTDVNEKNWLETLIKLKENQSNDEIEEEGNTNLSIKNKEICGFYDRLTITGKKYFDFFKYSYKFKYENQYYPVPGDKINFHILSHLFDIRSSCATIKENEQKFLQNELQSLDIYDDGIESFRKYVLNKFIPPPSWNTALLLRGIYVYQEYNKNYEKEKIKSEDQVKKIQSSNHPALSLFKKRLTMLLYSQLILSYNKPPESTTLSSEIVRSSEITTETPILNLNAAENNIDQTFSITFIDETELNNFVLNAKTKLPSGTIISVDKIKSPLAKKIKRK